jgi:Polyketide cyclase / dehydrase and lipid transport
MSVLLKILLWIIGIVAILAVVGFFLPRRVHIERSAAINATPSTLYSVVNDLKTYDNWMPWNRMDPNMQKQYSASTTGPGAYYTWQSNNKDVGTGKFEIVKADPDKNVTCELIFGDMKPSSTGWNISGNGAGSNITWFMDADMGMNPAGRWFGLFFDKMVGPDFQKGLDSLKAQTEAGKYH